MPVVLNQQVFRFRTDATKAQAGTPIWGAAQNVNFNPPVTTPFRIRFIVADTGSTSAASQIYNLYISRNGGAYAAITNVSTNAVYSADATAGTSTDNSAITTSLLTGGSGTFGTVGQYDFSGATAAFILATGTYVELEFGIVLNATAAASDTYDFRVYQAGVALNTYTVTPRIIVPVAATLSATQANQTLVGAGGPRVGGTLGVIQAGDSLTASGTVAGGAWTPANLGADLLLWLDGADAATITITGSGVSAWANKGASPAYTVQSIDSIRPSYASNAVTFTDPQVLALGNPPSVCDFFVVGTPHVNSNWRTLLHNGDGHNLVIIESGSYNLGTYNEVPPYFRQAGVETWPVVAGMAYGRIGSGEVFFSRDGGALTTTTCIQPVDKTTINFIGAYYSVANNASQGFGSINELILVPYNSSDDTRQRLEGYAAWKWGLQALLPSDHPYKAAPPQTGSPGITGALNVIQANETIVAAGKVTVSGVLSAQQANQTISAVGGPRVDGTLNSGQAANTLSGAGTIVSPGITGTLNVVQAANTLTGAGSVVVVGSQYGMGPYGRDLYSQATPAGWVSFSGQMSPQVSLDGSLTVSLSLQGDLPVGVTLAAQMTSGPLWSEEVCPPADWETSESCPPSMWTPVPPPLWGTPSGWKKQEEVDDVSVWGDAKE